MKVIQLTFKTVRLVFKASLAILGELDADLSRKPGLKS